MAKVSANQRAMYSNTQEYLEGAMYEAHYVETVDGILRGYVYALGMPSCVGGWVWAHRSPAEALVTTTEKNRNK